MMIDHHHLPRLVLFLVAKADSQREQKYSKEGFVRANGQRPGENVS